MKSFTPLQILVTNSFPFLSIFSTRDLFYYPQLSTIFLYSLRNAFLKVSRYFMMGCCDLVRCFFIYFKSCLFISQFSLSSTLMMSIPEEESLLCLTFFKLCKDYLTLSPMSIATVWFGSVLSRSILFSADFYGDFIRLNFCFLSSFCYLKFSTID